MRAQQEITPPRWADRLLAWYCKPELLEDLQGDLHECFARNVERKGVVRARLIYMVDVLKFFRLYIVRKPRFIDLLINWIMITSYVKTSGRTIFETVAFPSMANHAPISAYDMSIGLVVIVAIALAMIASQTLKVVRMNPAHVLKSE